MDQPQFVNQTLPFGNSRKDPKLPQLVLIAHTESKRQSK